MTVKELIQKLSDPEIAELEVFVIGETTDSIEAEILSVEAIPIGSEPVHFQREGNVYLTVLGDLF